MKYLLSFSVSVLVAALLIGVMPVHGESDIYDDVVRLHVLAESDSEQDQALKYKVRDAVLAVVSERVADAENRADAERILSSLLDEIRQAAEECVRENGGRCTVSVEFGKERYPRREYEGVALPAGVYQSLRVTLGAGEGQNWWCVLFPSVCMKFASDAEEYAAVGLTPEEYRVITKQSGTVAVRFRLLEVFEEWFGEKSSERMK